MLLPLPFVLNLFTGQVMATLLLLSRTAPGFLDTSSPRLITQCLPAATILCMGLHALCTSSQFNCNALACVWRRVCSLLCGLGWHVCVCVCFVVCERRDSAHGEAYAHVSVWRPILCLLGAIRPAWFDRAGRQADKLQPPHLCLPSSVAAAASVVAPLCCRCSLHADA